MKTPEELAEEYVLSRHDVNVEYSGTLEGCKDDFLAGYKAASPKWISVKDRLPEREQRVLWFNPTLYSPMCVDDISPDWNGSLEHNTYTHWMPLPKPPTEDRRFYDQNI